MKNKTGAAWKTMSARDAAHQKQFLRSSPPLIAKEAKGSYKIK